MKTLKNQMKKRKDIEIIDFYYIKINYLDDDSRMIYYKNQREVE